MPAPESPRPDLSAIPAFLRAPARQTATASIEGHESPAAFADRTPTALPRPVTPPPAPPSAPQPPRLDPASLPMPSLSRRRLITAAGVLVAGWLMFSFVRQVGEASAAADRADEL